MDQQDIGRTDPPPSADGFVDPSIAALSAAAGLAVQVAAAALAAVGEGLRRIGSEVRTVPDEEASEEQVVESAELVDAVGHAVVGVGAAVAQVTSRRHSPVFGASSARHRPSSVSPSSRNASIA